MTVRFAELADKARVITLLKNSRAGAGFDRPDQLTGFTFPFDPAYAERLFLAHLLPGAACIVLDKGGPPQGVLMAVAHEHPFGPVRMASETVWWIEPGYRGLAALRMLEAFELWARGQDCHYTGMAGMGDDPAVAALYRRRGYRTAETHYLKAM